MTTDHIKMLYIDDRMVTTDLDKAGYRSMGLFVRYANSFQKAVEVLGKEPIDIVVINYDYDKVNAPAVCQHFKNQEETKHIPIVITSVQTSLKTRQTSLLAGADLFIEQPIPRQYFVEKIKSLLEQQTRGKERINYQGEAKVSINGESFECPIGDISSSGILLVTDKFIQDGTPVDVEFLIPGYKKPIAIIGNVVRTVKPAAANSTQIGGIGIRFDEFKGDSQKRLERYVEKLAINDDKLIYYL